MSVVTLIALLTTTLQPWGVASSLSDTASSRATTPSGTPSARALDEEELSSVASQGAVPMVRALPLLSQLLSQLEGEEEGGVVPVDTAEVERALRDIDRTGIEGAEWLVTRAIPGLLDREGALESVERLTAALPSAETSDAARMVVAEFHLQAGRALNRRLDREGARLHMEDALKATSGVLSLLAAGEDVDPRLSILAVRHYEAARTISREAAYKAAAELEGLRWVVNSPVARAAVLFALGDHEIMTNNNPGIAYLRYYDASRLLENSGFPGCLEAAGTRCVFEWSLLHAEALAGTDRARRAAELYTGLVRGHDAESAGWFYHDAWMRRAAVQYVSDQDNVEAAYGVYSEYLDSHPSGRCVPEALLGAAWLYRKTEDNATAMSLYQEAARRFPGLQAGENAARQAGRMERLGFLSETEAETELAANERHLPLCGPMALAAWLRMRGNDTAVEALAKKAGTDDRGTSMKGLITAAAEHGLALCGVEAGGLDALPLPAIAYVRGNHFLLVVSREGEILRVVDGADPARDIWTGDFTREWDGKALVESSALETLQARGAGLGNPADTQVVGGDGREAAPKPLSPLAAESLGALLGGEYPDCPNHGPPCTGSSCDCAPPVGGPGGGGGPGRGGPGVDVPNNDLRCVMAPCPSSNPGGTGGNRGGSEMPEVGAMAGSSVQIFQSAQFFSETDLSIQIKGGARLEFARRFHNAWGWARGYTVDDTVVWGNNMGQGWVHGFNMHLVCSETVLGNGAPEMVAFFDQTGMSRYYSYSSEAGGVQTYLPTVKATPEFRLTTLTRNAATGRYSIRFDVGGGYDFSAETGAPDHYARLESVLDADGNTVTLSYNGAVGVGRLVQVLPPQGDDRYFEISYNVSGQISAVALRKSGVTPALKTVAYSYDDGRLEHVSHDDSSTMIYDYHMPTSTSGFFVSRKVDRRNREHLYDVDYEEGYWGYQAGAVIYTKESGLVTTYQRDVHLTNNYSTYCLVINYDANSTPLRRIKFEMAYDGYYLSKSIYYENPNGTGAQTWSYTYDSARRMTQVKRPNNVVYMTRTYTSEGRLATVVRPDGKTASWTYDSAGHITQFTDFTGVAVQYTYDAAGRLAREDRPGFGTNGFQYEYNTAGQCTRTTEPLGYQTNFIYDAVGNLVSVTNAKNETTTMTYDDLGRLLTQTNAANETVTYAYNDGCSSCGGGGIASITYPDNTSVEYGYDLSGRLISVTDPADNVTTYAYDTAGRLYRIYPPNSSGAYVEFSYDLLDRQTAVRDLAGKMQYTEYDYLDRVVRIADHNNATLAAYTYNILGQRLTATDGRGNTTTWVYTLAGDVLYEVDALGKYRIREYDTTTGRLTAVATTGNAVRTEYAYNAAGFLSGVTYKQTGLPDASVSYAYDENGRVIQMADWNGGLGVINFYDQLNRPVGRWDTVNGTIVTNAYDAAGRLASVTDNAGRQTSYAYSSMGRLTQVSAGGRSFNYAYDILGRRTQLQYPNGMTVAYAYDARGRLTDIHCRDAANVTLERYTYTFDGADNITQVVDAATAKWTYAYDDRYRLTQAERYLGATLKHRYTYTYDGADNAATQAVYNASAGTTNSIAYTYNAGNELTQAVSSANGTTSYAYDLWGRLTGITRGTQSASLGWAYQDRLKSYTTTLTGERSVNFAYTGDGRRMGVDNTLFGAKSWSYDGAWGVRTQSYASWPDYSRWYIQEPWGTVLAEAPVSGVVSDLRYYVRDHLGSTRSVRRENTTKFCWFEYDPYGTTYASGGVTGFTQDRFTGHEFDMETNMYWAPYRYYRPDMLRWASRDPLGMVDGPNVYWYAGGHPINYVDLLGQMPQSAVLAAWQCAAEAAAEAVQCGLGNGDAWTCAKKAACGCAGGAISGGIGGITKVAGLAAKLLGPFFSSGPGLSAIGGAVGNTAKCMCNKVIDKGLSGLGASAACCIGDALGGALGGAGLSALGKLQNSTVRAEVAGAVGRFGGGSWGSIAATALSFDSCCPQ